jgi:hypothetical protein
MIRQAAVLSRRERQQKLAEIYTSSQPLLAATTAAPSHNRHDQTASKRRLGGSDLWGRQRPRGAVS